MKPYLVILTIFIISCIVFPAIYWFWLTAGRWVAINYTEYRREQQREREREAAAAAAAATAAAAANAANAAGNAA